METKELKEMLFNKRKNGFSKISEETKNVVFDFSEGYKAYLNNSKTEREAVKTSRKVADRRYSPLDRRMQSPQLIAV